MIYSGENSFRALFKHDDLTICVNNLAFNWLVIHGISKSIFTQPTVQKCPFVPSGVFGEVCRCH
ncbi:protein of unknown function [Acidithiobacillus ferrivorans]|uniref:Uncharacterized protein n=1 Tax=Acidithiobacillus ferrivorans TaxID=160808 RepID=A0A060UKL5_9PROT|nr:hypothetical protein AFERRI_240066 [Acidithiobacillus ferrivorans]SMH64903.1 protein of unknown function [Acidithiobacillus ferrivorans]